MGGDSHEIVNLGGTLPDPPTKNCQGFKNVSVMEYFRFQINVVGFLLTSLSSFAFMVIFLTSPVCEYG